MRQFRILLAALVAAVLLPLLGIHGGEPKQVAKVEKTADLMKRKLTASQKILEGLAVNDLKQVAKNADELILISKDVEWRVVKTADYEVYSNEFRRNADTLMQMGKEKNLDGAALAYVELTLTCVRCHKHVREVRKVGLDELPDLTSIH